MKIYNDEDVADNNDGKEHYEDEDEGENGNTKFIMLICGLYFFARHGCTGEVFHAAVPSRACSSGVCLL